MLNCSRCKSFGVTCPLISDHPCSRSGLALDSRIASEVQVLVPPHTPPPPTLKQQTSRSNNSSVTALCYLWCHAGAMDEWMDVAGSPSFMTKLFCSMILCLLFSFCIITWNQRSPHDTPLAPRLRQPLTRPPPRRHHQQQPGDRSPVIHPMRNEVPLFMV